jgi:CDP-glucose 4,6-dehydratase
VTFPNIFESKRVFITGHTGFKGSWLASWMHLLGADVTGFALPPDYEGSHFDRLGLAKKIRRIEGDLRDAGRLRLAMSAAKPEFVFHLAAQPLVRRSYAEPKYTFDTNIGGSVNVLEAVRECETPRVLIYVTSDKCYRNKESQQGYRETDELGGDDPYSASKACAELVFASYQASFFNIPGSVRAASVRAGNVIGGGDWAEDRIVPDCMRALLKNEPIPVRNPSAVRPWQHVLEPLSGYIALAAELYRNPAPRGSWNFGPTRDAHRTVGELVDTLIELWGSGSKLVARQPERPLKETSLLYLNCDKAIRELGWSPSLTFRESLCETVDWYRRARQGDVWDLTTSQINAYVTRQVGEVVTA